MLIIRRCLEKKPERRYEGFAPIREALDRLAKETTETFMAPRFAMRFRSFKSAFAVIASHLTSFLGISAKPSKDLPSPKEGQEFQESRSELIDELTPAAPVMRSDEHPIPPVPPGMEESRAVLRGPDAAALPPLVPEGPVPPPQTLPVASKQPIVPFAEGEQGEGTVIIGRLPTAVLRSDLAAHPTAGEFTGIFDARPQSEARETVPPGPPPSAAGTDQEDARPLVNLTFTASADSGTVGRSIPMLKTPFKIGRLTSCDLAILSDSNLSREQCVIEWRDNAYHIRDLGSSNGTWLSGRLLKGTAILFSGAVIRLSSSTALTFVFNQSSELSDLTGQVLENRYELIEIIRSGSKSAVYRAADRRLPRRIAVKLFSPNLETYPGYLEQFSREAEMAACLSHPHIAKVLDFGSTVITTHLRGPLRLRFVCMEYMSGGALRRGLPAARPNLHLRSPPGLSPFLRR